MRWYVPLALTESRPCQSSILGCTARAVQWRNGFFGKHAIKQQPSEKLENWRIFHGAYPKKGLGKKIFFVLVRGYPVPQLHQLTPYLRSKHPAGWEKMCACGVSVLLTSSDDFIAQHETSYMWSTWRVAIYRSRTTWSCYPPPTKHSVPGQTEKNSSMPCWFWAIPQVRWLIAEKKIVSEQELRVRWLSNQCCC